MQVHGTNTIIDSLFDVQHIYFTIKPFGQLLQLFFRLCHLELSQLLLKFSEL